MSSTPELPPRPDRRAQEDERLQMLAARVRHLRALRGMPRQLCAKQAGVSLPHLARLEAGTYNVSVLVLDRIARALDVPLDALLSSPTSPHGEWVAQLVRVLPEAELDALAATLRKPQETTARMSRRIALLGIRGAGKSTVGARLASTLGLPVVELTREIEQATGVPVPELFAMRGQGGYRAVEEQTLKAILQRDEFVLIAGGGVVAQPRSYTLLMRNCFTVWLHAKPEICFARTHAQKDERISTATVRAYALDNIRRMMEARRTMYETATMGVDTSDLTVDEVVARVVQRLPPAG